MNFTVIENGRRDVHGAWHFGAMLENGIVVWRTYYDYTKAEARRRFRSDCAEEASRYFVEVTSLPEPRPRGRRNTRPAGASTDRAARREDTRGASSRPEAGGGRVAPVSAQPAKPSAEAGEQ